jgi:hypothetical protein
MFCYLCAEKVVICIHYRLRILLKSSRFTAYATLSRQHENLPFCGRERPRKYFEFPFLEFLFLKSEGIPMNPLRPTQEQAFEFDFAMCHGSYGYR